MGLSGVGVSCIYKAKGGTKLRGRTRGEQRGVSFFLTGELCAAAKQVFCWVGSITREGCFLGQFLDSKGEARIGSSRADFPEERGGTKWWWRGEFVSARGVPASEESKTRISAFELQQRQHSEDNKLQIFLPLDWVFYLFFLSFWADFSRVYCWHVWTLDEC